MRWRGNELDRRALLGAAAAGVIAHPFSSRGAEARRGVLNAMMPAEPATLCYPLVNNRLAQEICGNINESLLLFDWQFRPHPNLARGFAVSPDGADLYVSSAEQCVVA